MTNALTALVMLFILSFSPFDAFALDFDAEIRKIVNLSAEFAQSAPEPDPSDLYTDILLEETA